MPLARLLIHSFIHSYFLFKNFYYISGFFYGCYPETEDDGTGTGASSLGNQKMFFHRVGTEQKDDVKCAEFNDHPKWMM